MFSNDCANTQKLIFKRCKQMSEPFKMYKYEIKKEK